MVKITTKEAAGDRYHVPLSPPLIILTPRLSALIAALQADRNPTHQREIYQRFDSELLEEKPT
jgi:hypothetical protein